MQFFRKRRRVGTVPAEVILARLAQERRRAELIETGVRADWKLS